MDLKGEPTRADFDVDLLIASNRLPISLTRGSDGCWQRESGSGGLVSALDPVLRQRGGTWVGWPGVLEGEIAFDELHALLGASRAEQPYEVEPVALTAEEQKDFYQGFCNEVLWPLFHGFLDRCRFERHYWEVYKRVNRKYAAAIQRSARPGQIVWVQDYHLLLVGEQLRAEGLGNRTGFFLHIPFPPIDLFERLPWCREILKGMLGFDVIGFQTRRDWKNFRDCVRALSGTEHRVQADEVLHTPTGRVIQVGVHPISIENGDYGDASRTQQVATRAAELREEIRSEKIILGVDRLDYIKGIPEKLLAFERALERYPQLQGKVTLVQLVIPSRARIPEYSRMKEYVERLVGRINGRFTRGGWAPILYQYGNWSASELLSFYRASDVALVSSLRDGMNLVSKEYVAASVERGALVLSEFAGSAEELKGGALLVNPHDIEAMAEIIHRAVTMPEDERSERLLRMQSWIEGHDVHRWVRGFLARALGETREDEAASITPMWTEASVQRPRPARGMSRGALRTRAAVVGTSVGAPLEPVAPTT